MNKPANPPKRVISWWRRVAHLGGEENLAGDHPTTSSGLLNIKPVGPREVETPFFMPFPSERSKLWVGENDRVVVIKIDEIPGAEGGQKFVGVFPGRIYSSGKNSAFDNVHTTAVLCDQAFFEGGSDPDGRRIVDCSINSPLLFRREEAEVLKNLSKALLWFEDRCLREVVEQIVHELNTVSLDKPDGVTDVPLRPFYG